MLIFNHLKRFEISSIVTAERIECIVSNSGILIFMRCLKYFPEVTDLIMSGKYQLLFIDIFFSGTLCKTMICSLQSLKNLQSLCFNSKNSINIQDSQINDLFVTDLCNCFQYFPHLKVLDLESSEKE